MSKYTKEHISLWIKNPNTNPKTNKKITMFGPVFNKYIHEYELLIKSNDKIFEEEITYDKCKPTNIYMEYRKNNIEIFTMSEINPLDKSIFKFYHQWDPYNGKRGGIDPSGPLLFDANALIHYWYVKRLNNLWMNPNDNHDYDDANDANTFHQNTFHGYYGDALGNGPDFFIPSRGKHMDWYLFRLPVFDCYLPHDHNDQIATMGPILSDKEIDMVYKLAKKTPYPYNYKRPNLLLLKKYYENAISMNPSIPGIDYKLSDFISSEDWNNIRFEENKKWVEKLIHM